MAYSLSKHQGYLDLSGLKKLPPDPEIPGTTDQLKLAANLSGVTWTSDTLNINGEQATLTPGTHRLHLTHSETKQSISCEFKVEAL